MSSDSVIQTSFNAGEWAPALYSRVDLKQYHSGAALLRNFFVDYRGGATVRAGTKYILQTRSTLSVRLIPFQASFTVTYVLEFGQGYVRFYNNGAPVLETAKTITAINIGTGNITSAAHGYSNGDWVFVSGISGTVGNQLNGNYYTVGVIDANTYKLSDLNGVVLTLTGAYTSGGSTQRVYTLLNSPYQAVDLAQLRFVQNGATMIICHPNYPPYQLVLTSATSWAISAITIGATIPAPSAGFSFTLATLVGGTAVYVAYVVTSVDSTGQESGPSAYQAQGLTADPRTTAGTISLSWTAVTGAQSYNVYRTIPRYGSTPPGGSYFGFVGNVTGTTFTDSNVTPNFAIGPPLALNPFAGSGLQSITLGSGGSYTTNTNVTISFSGAGVGTGATAVVGGWRTTALAIAGGTNTVIPWVDGDIIYFANGLTATVTTSGTGVITGVTIIANGTSSSSICPGSYVPYQLYSHVRSNYFTWATYGATMTFTITWTITAVSLTAPGTGYSAPTNVNFSSGAATATVAFGAAPVGNPTVPGVFQQRLVLAGPVASPGQINMSQSGVYYNFNVNTPLEADDAIQGTLSSGTLATIQSMISQPYGLITLTDRGAWLISGGSPTSAVTPLNFVANPQVFSGANSQPPPFVAGDNIVYVQAKGSIVRSMVFDYYKQIYTGADISILSSHFFYGYQLKEWAWAEEPYKVAWVIRNDGMLLSLTLLKEQELTAWAQHDSGSGLFKSVTSVVEAVPLGNVDATYFVVQRTINGNTVQYIERMTELYYPSGLQNAWTVDAGINYTGTGALTFSGAQHLAGATVTGVATDNLGNTSAITPFTMPTTGTFTLSAPAGATNYISVTVGLPYTPQLGTLPLDLGEPTVQGKRKKVSGLTLKVKDALGLYAGRSLGTAQVAMADLVIGNIGSASNTVVTGLTTTDVRLILDPQWDVFGQYYITQPNPFPATVLGVIPEITVEDRR